MCYRKVALLLLALSLLFNKYCTAEEINISTYYPSPYGSYKNLRLYPGTPPTCDANNEGLMYYDNTENTVKICRQTGSLPDTYDLEPETYWVKSGNDIYNTNSGLVMAKAGVYAEAGSSSAAVRGLTTLATSWAGSFEGGKGVYIEKKLGIGTTLPDTILHINEDSYNVPTIKLENNTGLTTSFGTTGGIQFYGLRSGGYSTRYASIFGWVSDNNNPNFTGELIFNLPLQGTFAPRMVIDGDRVGIGTTGPFSAVALLDVSSATKGFLPPRMTTTQRNAISSPPAGLMIYNTSTNKLNFYNGSAWEAVTSS